jgi:hypothetical protein
MKTIETIVGMIAGFGICCCLLFGFMGSCAEGEVSQASAPSGQSGASKTNTKQVELPIYLSALDVFGDIERPPVKFNHDRHTAALEPESCERCHPKDAKGALLFSFPKAASGKTAKALMNSFHDECIGCHRKRAADSKKGGPVSCGECHRAEKDAARKEYAPILPEHYDAAKDAYHRDCLACHRAGMKPPNEARVLDWKSFSIEERKQGRTSWPKMVFDYRLHARHDKALDRKCGLCHTISPARRQKLAAEGKEPANLDWVLDTEGASLSTDKKGAHALCIDCHRTRKAGEKQGGPLFCGGCHAGIERTIQEMTGVPRIECGQKDKYLIELKEDARAGGVPFNHRSHEANSRSCQECHHKTLRPCIECHTVKGNKDGGGVALAEAYHKASSSWSCIGCHKTIQRRPACAGCHARMADGLTAAACSTCHSRDPKTLDAGSKLPPPKELLPGDTKSELAIGVMNKAYHPAKMPHLAIITKLTDLSNQSALASYFHRDEATVCAGCHHHAPLQRRTKTPQCSACHMNRQQTEDGTPALLGAYHQQCLGCHGQMARSGMKLPQNCTGCHEEKRTGATE